MGLTHDSYIFGGSDLHSIVRPTQAPELPISTGRFFGVKGVSHLIGQPYERPLECEYLLSDYSTPEALRNALNEIDDQAGALTGTLTESGNFAQTYENCTFIGFERSEPFFDGSGAHHWCVSGRLKWIQRSL